MRKENRQENEVITIYSTLNRADRCTYFLSLSLSLLCMYKTIRNVRTQTHKTRI